jgi:hypothetical protein
MAPRRRRDPVRLGGALPRRERRRLAARIGTHPFGARAGAAHDRRRGRGTGSEEESESGEGEDGSHAGCDAGSVLPVARLLALQGALYFLTDEDRETEHLDFGESA